jgi:hypothetical protein
VGEIPLLTVSKELKMNHQEASDKLYQIGFSASEIERLERLRRAYAQSRHTHMSETYRRLEFVRWLVITGKLTEQIA